MRTRFVSAAVTLLLLASCQQASVPTVTAAIRGQKSTPSAGLTTQVINGSVSAVGARPYQVALLSGGRQFCGGTLLSDQWVLTAAHCVVGTSVSSISVRAGSLYATSGGQLKSVISGGVHPSFTDVTRAYDVAVLRVSSPFTLSSTVAPASLPTPAFAANAAAVGSVQAISGWGMTVGGNSNSASTVLREANLPVISNSACGTQLGQTIPGGMICGDKNSQGQTGCHGDSGGPFASNRNGKFYVFGVVSWGVANVCSKATAFARVGEYQPWITSMTGVQPQDGGGTMPAPGTTYTGSVSSGTSSYKPGTNGFSYSGGTLTGSLSGPSGSDFDLFLQKLNGSTWTDVAGSEGGTSSERLSYAATSGTYRWEVYAYSGSGSYTLTETR